MRFDAVARQGKAMSLALGNASVIGAFAQASYLKTKGGYMPKLRNGHAPGHVRDTFIAAIEAFYHWNRGEPEPTVGYEIHYVPHQIPISKACGLVWNCTGVLPGIEWNLITELLGRNKGTYAAAARLMLPAIKEQLASC